MTMWKIILAVALGILLLIQNVSLAQQEKPEPAPLVERGRYLVENAFCSVCHATLDADGRRLPGMELAGGRVMAEGGYRAIMPNITSDTETGIGGWTDSEIARAIRDGRRPNGSIIGPPMPIELYRSLSDRDLAAVVAYLRTVPPVYHAVTERSTYKNLPPSYGPSVSSVADPSDDPVTRGAYLAGPVAQCTICHTPRLPNGLHDWSRIGAGGSAFEGPWGVVASRNITSHKEFGIGAWTDEQIIRAVTQGVSTGGQKLAPPMGGRASVYARWTARDQRDLLAYLRSLPPQGPEAASVR